jgi:hypothetical protein
MSPRQCGTAPRFAAVRSPKNTPTYPPLLGSCALHLFRAISILFHDHHSAIRKREILNYGPANSCGGHTPPILS